MTGYRKGNKMSKEHCCKEFDENIRNSGGFEVDGRGKEVNVGGCCGGGCYVLIELKYCPYCGKEIRFV